jgi:hypothetical protein
VTPSLDKWVTYSRWNSALAGEFFGGRYGGRPVYIDLEDDALARVAEVVGLEADQSAAPALICAVRPTLGLTSGTSLFGAHVARLRTWRRGDRDSPPPIIGVLAFQSLVAEGMRSDDDFRASNYYGRFLQTLGLEPNDRNLRSKVLRGFVDQSGEMWSALNRWLLEDPETRGVPTAFSFDYRVHVGLPMSQALVRASDRSAIRTLFSDLGLRPGQAIAVEDMVRLLQAWLPDSRVSRSLKTLCVDEHAIQRVAEVACIELEAWGGGVEDASASSRNMVLTATLRRLPRRSLRLGVAIRAAEEIEAVSLLSESDEAGRTAVGAVDTEIPLGVADGEGWRAVVHEFSVPDLLFARLRLGTDSLRTARDPRTVIVLAKPSEGGAYREAERVRLGSDHLLLVVDPVRARVERELASIARPGFRVHETLPGLPSGWVLFEGVEIVAISETTAPDLAVLVPLAWTEVAVEGGLRLPGRATWHSTARPEIRASAPPGRVVAIAIVRERSEGETTDDDALTAEAPSPHDGDAQESRSSDEADDEATPAGESPEEAGVEALELFEEAAVIDLAEIDLGDGDYRVQLFDGALTGRALGATTFRLRSASSPFFPVLRSTLAYALDEPLGALSAHAEQVGVQGALVPFAAPTAEADPAEGTAARDLPSRRADPDDESELDDLPAKVQRQSSVPECFITGAHYFLLESAARGRRRWEQTFEGACKYCGLEKSFPARPRRRGAPARGAAARMSRATATPPVRLLSPSQAVDHDLIFDALCCVGTGTYAALEQLVEQLDDRPWAARETARRLVSLGHIDVELDHHLRPRSWSISPPTLAASAAGAFLAGWRSPELLFALGRVASEMGARVEWIPQSAGPSRVGLLGVDEGNLDVLARRLSAVADIEVAVARDAPLRIAQSLPTLGTLRRSLPMAPVLPASAPLLRLDLESLRWARADSMSAPGAYQAGHRPRLSLHKDNDDTRIAEVRLAKWLALGHTPLLAHDTERRRALCHIGTEPPGLYERALVLCSGLLPQSLEGHLAEYSDVPVEVVTAIASRLAASAQINA